MTVKGMKFQAIYMIRNVCILVECEHKLEITHDT